MSNHKKSRAPEADKPSYTVAEINSFLDRRVGRTNFVRDTVENV